MFLYIQVSTLFYANKNLNYKNKTTSVNELLSLNIKLDTKKMTKRTLQIMLHSFRAPQCSKAHKAHPKWSGSFPAMAFTSAMHISSLTLTLGSVPLLKFETLPRQPQSFWISHPLTSRKDLLSKFS